jgi:hypothetical protein
MYKLLKIRNWKYPAKGTVICEGKYILSREIYSLNETTFVAKIVTRINKNESDICA